MEKWEDEKTIIAENELAYIYEEDGKHIFRMRDGGMGIYFEIHSSYDKLLSILSEQISCLVYRSTIEGQEDIKNKILKKLGID